MVKILEPVCGLLSNSEVLQVLYDRGADGQRPGSRALPSEKLAYHFLNAHSAGIRQASSLREFIKELEPFNLSRTEVLGLINNCPTSPVEMHLLIEDCENRLSEEQMERLLYLVDMHLRH